MNSAPRKRDLGLVGVIVIITEAISNFHSYKNIKQEFDQFKFDLRSSQAEIEARFVSQADIAKVTQKLDELDQHLHKLHKQVKLISNRYSQTAKDGKSWDISSIHTRKNI